MDGFLLAFTVSTAVVFVAELGDKSQLMALTFATRYRTWPVLVGITIATAVVHLISVGVGYGLGAALPTGWISLVAAVAFVGFGFWTLRGDELSDDEAAKAQRSGGSAVFAASVAFFLAELGDKTMLATITLATQYGWFGVWVGSTLGMVVADALAIVVGRQLGKRLPERTITFGAAGLFFVFGAWLAVEATEQLTGGSAWTAVADALNHHLAGWIALALGVVAVVAGAWGRRWARAGHRGTSTAAGFGTPAWWSRVLFGLALLLGLGAPLLVAADVIQPLALLSRPSYVVVGAGVVLLGLALLLASLAQVGTVRRRGPALLATTGLYARVRNPAFTGMVVATAGTLVMAPTVLGLLATVLIVVAVQIQARAVREPGLSRVLGPEYAQYMARTGRFLPKVRPTDPAPAGLRDGGRSRVG